MTLSEWWRRIRRVWVALGIGATILFVSWSLIAYRASPGARRALAGDGDVDVRRSTTMIAFVPAEVRDSVGLVFFPGALVDPVAYAPLARSVAAAGVPVYLLLLPKRGAFGGADDPRLHARADSILGSRTHGWRWVVGGHSRGGVIASTIASRTPGAVGGLILIGTSHPRDVDLSGLSVPVAKIVGTRDGLASPPEVRANAHLLPATTDWTWVAGGNHSQFGSYGFQPGDRRAAISREEQRRVTLAAVHALIHRAASAPAPADARTNAPAPALR